MSSDVGNISRSISYLIFLVYTPVNIIVIFFQLYILLGSAAGLGLLVMGILMPINMYISHKINQLFIVNAKNKDEKMKLLNEVLTGIKVILVKRGVPFDFERCCNWLYFEGLTIIIV